VEELVLEKLLASRVPVSWLLSGDACALESLLLAAPSLLSVLSREGTSTAAELSDADLSATELAFYTRSATEVQQLRHLHSLLPQDPFSKRPREEEEEEEEDDEENADGDSDDNAAFVPLPCSKRARPS